MTYLRRLDGELRRRGVPAGRRRQLLAELGDHIHDLTDEGGPMTDATIETKLGDPAAVAAAADREYRRCGWAARRPWLAFGLLPLPLGVGCLAGVLLGMAALDEAAGWCGTHLLGRWDWRNDAGWGVIKLLPPVLAAWVVVGWAVRHRPAAGWVAVAVVQVAAFAGCLFSHTHRGDGPESTFFTAGFVPVWYPWNTDHARAAIRSLAPVLLVQACLPVVVAAARLRLARRPAAA